MADAHMHTHESATHDLYTMQLLVIIHACANALLLERSGAELLSAGSDSADTCTDGTNSKTAAYTDRANGIA